MHPDTGARDNMGAARLRDQHCIIHYTILGKHLPLLPDMAIRSHPPARVKVETANARARRRSLARRTRSRRAAD